MNFSSAVVVPAPPACASDSPQQEGVDWVLISKIPSLLLVCVTILHGARSLAGTGGRAEAAASPHFCPGHLCWNGTGMVQQVLPFLTRDLPLVCPQPEPGWSCQVPSFRAGRDLEATENGDRKNWHGEMLGASRSRAVPAQTGPSGERGWSRVQKDQAGCAFPCGISTIPQETEMEHPRRHLKNQKPLGQMRLRLFVVSPCSRETHQ